MEGTNGILANVQKDIRTLRFMAKQKEKEWNYILKLMKVKEELQAKLMRRREVLKITTASASSSGVGLAGGRTKLNLPSAAQLQAVAAQHQSQASLQNFISQSLSAIMGGGGGTSSGAKSSGGGGSARNNMAGGSFTTSSAAAASQSQQQQLFQQASKLLNRQRPILPKPTTQAHPEVWNSHHHHQQHHHSGGSSSSGQLADPSGGSHGGTISVQSLIADHRAKHPEEIPTRGRRIRQPSRICNDPNSSSSPPPSSQQPDPASGVSFKARKRIANDDGRKI